MGKDKETAEQKSLRFKQLCIRLKFKKENIQIHDEVCSACIEDLETILNLISKRDTEENYENIDTYIENL